MCGTWIITLQKAIMCVIEMMFVKCITVELVKITDFLLPFPWKVCYLVHPFCAGPDLGNLWTPPQPNKILIFRIISFAIQTPHTFVLQDDSYFIMNHSVNSTTKKYTPFLPPVNFFFTFCKRSLSTKNNPALRSREHSAKVTLFWGFSQRHFLCQIHGTWLWKILISTFI